jgi:hypothetical protein
MSIGGRFQPKNQPARMGQSPLADHPGRHQFAHRAEGNPHPGIAIDFLQLLQRRQVRFFLVDERPQLIQLALRQMQIAEKVVHHALTVITQHGQPMIDGIFIHFHQPSGGTNAQAFGQSFRPPPIDTPIGTYAGICCARAGRDDRLAHPTLKTWASALPIIRLQLDGWPGFAKQGTLPVPTVTRRVIHSAAPRTH